MFFNIDTWILPLILILSWFYFYIKRRYAYWTDRDIPGPRPLPLLGNIHHRALASIHHLEISWMHQFGSIYGTFVGFEPKLTVIDPQLIKQILVKDFNHFTNRFKVQLSHKLWNQNLLFANATSWRRLRSITTPAFSTGKLRAMLPLMEHSVDNLVDYFHRISSSSNGIISTKEMAARFTIDLMAATCFATKTDALNEIESPLVANGRAFFDMPPLRVAGAFLLPSWALRLVGIDSFFSPKPFQFLIEFTKHIVRERRLGRSQARADLVQLLVDAGSEEAEVDDEIGLDSKENPKSKLKPHNTSSTLTESEITANLIFLLVAGFETTSATISHCLFELANNLEIQHRLHLELNTTLGSFESTKSTEYYEIITGLPYLDAVVQETLRMYPPITQITRITGTDGYKLAGVELFKGQIIEIPITALHHSAAFFPNPETFNPERFLPTNRQQQIVPYSYLPFGAGPRNCIGARFACQVIKLCLAALVRRFQFNPTLNTPAELSFKAGNPLLISNEFELQVTKRF